MIIGMSCTRNWYQYLLVNIFAILSNNKVDKFYLFIEDDYIEELSLFEKKFDTKFICINSYKIFEKYISKDSPNFNTRYTKSSMVRLFFSKEVNEDKLLYLDVDALVTCDISDLWNMKMDNCYVAGTPDSGMKRDGVVYLKFIDSNIPYINSGVLLMNLELIRKDKIDDKWLYLINHERFMYPDQDVINSACKGHVGVFPVEYNSSVSTKLLENKDEIKIIHYTMKKTDWVREHQYSELWYKYDDLYEEFKKNAK